MKKLSILLPVVALLSACGGSDSNGDTVSPPTPPVTQLPEIINGELTALNKATGAATVGRYNVDLRHLNSTRSIIETLEHLEVGMVLTLRTDGALTVESVVYNDLLVAPVVSYDADAGKLVMAGKTVLTQGAKLEVGLLLGEGLIGKILEISGFTIDQNTIQATYIELDEQDIPPGQAVFGEIEGVVTNLDDSAKTFNIGPMTIDYAGAFVLFPLQNGSWVEVAGSFAGNSITATAIELEEYDYADNATIDVEGRVTQVSTDKVTGRVTKLLLNGSRTIDLSLNSVKYEDFPYSSAGNPIIKSGMSIEVEGRWVNNTIQALEVECDYGCQNNPTVPPTIPTTPPIGNGEFNVEGMATFNAATNTISLNGFSFVVGQFAEWEDIHPTNWTTPTWVSLSGMMDTQTNLVWEIENEYHPENEIDLEGIVAVDAGVYSLWGYRAADNSLANITARWGMRVDVECRYDQSAKTISFCQFDD